MSVAKGGGGEIGWYTRSFRLEPQRFPHKRRMLVSAEELVVIAQFRSLSLFDNSIKTGGDRV